MPSPSINSVSLLEAAGPVAAADRQILLDALSIMLVIVLPTIALTLFTAWWFRASNRWARRRPQWAYSGRLELLVWSIPLLTIVFLGGVIWIGSHRLDPFRPLAPGTRALEVQVVSLDWKWLFIYPDQGIAAVNRLVVPVGVPLHFSLTSASVMNAFFVPSLGSMIATMNGMETQLHLQADRAGDFDGESAQFSGDGFSGMHFVLHAVAPGDFDAWVHRVRGAGGVLDRAAYAELARQSLHVAPFTYGGVEPGLFGAVLTRAVAPGPGPRQAHGGRGVSPRPAG